MAYQISGTNRIKDDNTVAFKNVTVTNRYALAEGIGGFTSGYTSGGNTGGYSNVIDKFPFASDGNATDVGDLTLGRNSMSEGANSASSGYLSGGFVPPAPGTKNVIEKFPFSSDANATDVGDLTVEKSESSGQQV